MAALCVALGLGRDPQSILTAVQAVYDRVDREVAQRTLGLGLPCRAGCDACCHEAVFLSAPEFFATAVFLLRHRSLEDRRRIVVQMRTLAARFEDELELLESIAPGPERDEVAQRVRFRCPLLADDGRCSVYPVRELNGRTFGMSRDESRNAPFGCQLTHDRLRVLPSEAMAELPGARASRRWLRDGVPGASEVRVYPWWFSHFGAYLLGP